MTEKDQDISPEMRRKINYAHRRDQEPVWFFLGLSTIIIVLFVMTMFAWFFL